ncbi:MAG: putative membrane protein [Alteromonas naphthalenivorans]|jgi:uncharacterized membrane protein
MISFINLSLFLFCVGIYSTCSIILKKVDKKSLFVLWTLPIMYIFVYIGFFSMSFYQGQTFYTIVKSLYHFSGENIPFYLLRSADLILANIMLFYILNNFPISQAALVFQIAIPISSLYYFALGEPITLTTILGIFLVTIGAVTAGLKKLEYNILKPLATIPPKLYLVGTLRAFFQVTGTILIFIVSTKTWETKSIHTALNFRDLGYTHFDTVLHYAMGGIPFIVIPYLLYFFIVERVSYTEMKLYGKNNFRLILLNSFLEALTFLLYIIVFQSVQNKLLLTIIEKCKIPFTLFLASTFLKEKVGPPQIVATVLIIAGGLLSLL